MNEKLMPRLIENLLSQKVMS